MSHSQVEGDQDDLQDESVGDDDSQQAPGPSTDDLIGAALLSEFKLGEEGDDDSNGNDEGLPPEDEEDDADGKEGSQAPAPELTRWKDIVTSNPARISEVPAALRADVINALVDDARGQTGDIFSETDENGLPKAIPFDIAQRTVADAYRRGEFKVRLDLEFARVAELNPEDREEAMTKWAPSVRESYFDWKSGNAQATADLARTFNPGPPTGPAAAPQGEMLSKEDLEAKVVPIYENLKTVPEALAAVQKLAEDPNRYPPTEVGVLRLERDAAQELLKHQQNPRSGADEDEKASRRREMAARRKGLAKPEASPGSAPAPRSADVIDRITDPDELISIGLRQSTPG